MLLIFRAFKALFNFSHTETRNTKKKTLKRIHARTLSFSFLYKQKRHARTAQSPTKKRAKKVYKINVGKEIKHDKMYIGKSPVKKLSS